MAEIVRLSGWSDWLNVDFVERNRDTVSADDAWDSPASCGFIASENAEPRRFHTVSVTSIQRLLKPGCSHSRGGIVRFTNHDRLQRAIIFNS